MLLSVNPQLKHVSVVRYVMGLAAVLENEIVAVVSVKQVAAVKHV